jgi:hypothetical protein
MQPPAVAYRLTPVACPLFFKKKALIRKEQGFFVKYIEIMLL